MHLAQIESAPGERGEKAKRKQRSANRRSIGRRNGRGLLVSIHYLSFAKELPGNHQALNLARAFANRAQLHVAIVFLRRIVFDKAVPAVNLYAFVGHLHSNFARKQFCQDRKSTRLNSSHGSISYAVFCLKKKK